MSKLELFLDGKKTDFHSASITYSLDNIAHTFTVSMPPVLIDSAFSVKFSLDGKNIFNGQVDSVSMSIDSDSLAMSISGRSMCANLIDSVITMDAVYNQDLSKLMNSVCADFDIDVVSSAKTEEVEEFQINAESPINALAQLVREQGFMLVERGGKLSIEKPASKKAQIAVSIGKNISSLSIEKDFSTRFHSIEVEGAWAEEAKAKSIDQVVNKSRKKVIIADQLQSTASCQSRADYEKKLGIANSMTAQCTIPFISPDLGLEQLNAVITVLCDTQKMKFNQNMLIKTITLNSSDSEQSTNLSLCIPFTESAPNDE